MGQLRNPRPGEILKEEFLNEIGVSQNQLAQAFGVPGNRIHAIVNGTRDITAERTCVVQVLWANGWLFFAPAECLRHLGGQEVAKIKRYKSDRSDGGRSRAKERTIDALQEAAGVEFSNGDQPGVHLTTAARLRCCRRYRLRAWP